MSQVSQSFITSDGIYFPTRVFHGIRNAGMPLPSTISSSIQLDLYPFILCWMDNILFLCKTIDECLDAMRYNFLFCKQLSIKLHLNKGIIFPSTFAGVLFYYCLMASASTLDVLIKFAACSFWRPARTSSSLFARRSGCGVPSLLFWPSYLPSTNFPRKFTSSVANRLDRPWQDFCSCPLVGESLSRTRSTAAIVRSNFKLRSGTVIVGNVSVFIRTLVILSGQVPSRKFTWGLVQATCSPTSSAAIDPLRSLLLTLNFGGHLLRKKSLPFLQQWRIGNGFLRLQTVSPFKPTTTNKGFCDALAAFFDLSQTLRCTILQWAVRMSAYNYTCLHTMEVSLVWADLFCR